MGLVVGFFMPGHRATTGPPRSCEKEPRAAAGCSEPCHTCRLARALSAYPGCVGELPVRLGLSSPSDSMVPPALRYRIADVLGLLPAAGKPVESVALERLVKLIGDGEPWLGADPSLAEV